MFLYRPNVFWMAFFVPVYLFVLFTTLVSAQPQLLLDSGDDSPHCDLDCSSAGKTLICGTDGRTYDSECEISRANCEGHLVRMKHVGQCSDAARCLVERAHAQEMARKPAAGIFIPDCLPDGSYIDVQCHAGTGYCWCVTKQGKPIPGSSARYKRPNCVSYQNANSHKRTSRGKKPRRSCSITDREEFNKNMIKIFVSEFNRTQDSRNTASLLPLHERAANWKFTQLDLSKNEQLSKSELRDLRRMVKKIIRPRPCARTFTQYCDLDQNKNITRQEWTVCLGVNSEGAGNLAMKEMRLPAETPRTTTPITPETEAPPRSHGSLRPVTSPTFAPSQVTLPTSQLYKPILNNGRGPISWRNELKILSSSSVDSGLLAEGPPTDSSEKRRDPSKKKKPNCAAERSKALLKQGNEHGAGIYVPNCEKSGSYANIQCHSATGFCWCVNPENGTPIPQTTTHNSQPNCNVAAIRPLRGCPAQRKESFLDHLTSMFSSEMVNAFVGNRTSFVPEFKPSKDESLRWKFRILDANQNSFIERSEWRVFKQFMATQERLSKCGRGFYKFCDADENRRVSLTEWLQCTNLSNENEQRKLPRVRTGPNPLKTYLKAD